MQPVYLIGFMGSGKTTLGNALHGAAMPDGTILTFVDLDHAIEQVEGMSVGDIFRQKGEDYFRRKEAATLRRLTVKPGIVVACGGGTPCHSGNMEWMNAKGLTVLLQASEPVLLRRLIEGAHKRPLLAGLSTEELQRFIADKQAQRMPHYSQAALTFNSDLLESAEDIAQSRRAFLNLLATHMP